jgi:large subunit ribosomal protein L35
LAVVAAPRVLRFILSGRITVPKIKTYKSAAKRFRRTGSGKLVAMHQGRGHLRRRKAKRTLLKYREVKVLTSAAAEKHIKQLAPYID